MLRTGVQNLRHEDSSQGEEEQVEVLKSDMRSQNVA